MENKQNKVISLDGMRGLLAVVVMLHHFAAAFYPGIIFGPKVGLHSKIENLIYSTPLNLFFAGNFAVTIFFVLSGYVLSYNFFRYHDFKRLRISALRRYSRLMIPVFGSVFIAYILLKLNFFYNLKIFRITLSTLWLNQYYNFKPDFFKMLYEGTVGIFVDPQNWQYNNVIWIMYYEFFGSFIVFATLSLFGLMKNRVFIYLALIVVFWNSYLLSFVLGMLTCDMEKYIRSDTLFTNFIRKYFFLFLLPISLFLGSYQGKGQSSVYNFLSLPGLTIDQLGVLYHIIAAFLFLHAVIYLRWLSYFFSNRIFLFLGKISFSLYLLHPIIIFSFSSFIFYSLWPYLNYYYHINFLITFISSVIIVIFLSYLYTKYVVEKEVALSQSFIK